MPTAQYQEFIKIVQELFDIGVSFYMAYYDNSFRCGRLLLRV